MTRQIRATFASIRRANNICNISARYKAKAGQRGEACRPQLRWTLSKDPEPWASRSIYHHVNANVDKDQFTERKCRCIGSACRFDALKIVMNTDTLNNDPVPLDVAPSFAYLLVAAIVLDLYSVKEGLEDNK